MTKSAAARRDLRRRRVGRIAVYAGLCAFTILMFLPLYSMIALASAQDNTDLSGVSFNGFRLIGNIQDVMSNGSFPRYLFNSILIASTVSLFDVALSAAAGYALARLAFPGRRVLFVTVVISLSLAPIVVTIPVFIMLRDAGWLDSYKGLIAPFIVSALGVFLVRQFALGIPMQMLHAARVDGVGEFRIFLRIAVPLLRPALLTLLLLQFLTQWDNLLWPLIAASSQDLWTVPLGLASFQGEYGIDFRLLTTAAFVSILPPLILFAALQRYYVSGLTLGGVKR